MFSCNILYLYQVIFCFIFFSIEADICKLFRVNQSMFSGASRIDAYASGKEVVNVKLPSLIAVEGSNAENEDTDKSVVKHSVSKEASTFPAFSQQIPDLVTLSLLPKSQWQSLINLDIIKVYSPSIIMFL